MLLKILELNKSKFSNVKVKNIFTLISCTKIQFIIYGVINIQFGYLVFSRKEIHKAHKKNFEILENTSSDINYCGYC